MLATNYIELTYMKNITKNIQNKKELVIASIGNRHSVDSIKLNTIQTQNWPTL